MCLGKNTSFYRPIKYYQLWCHLSSPCSDSSKLASCFTSSPSVLFLTLSSCSFGWQCTSLLHLLDDLFMVSAAISTAVPQILALGMAIFYPAMFWCLKVAVNIWFARMWTRLLNSCKSKRQKIGIHASSWGSFPANFVNEWWTIPH